METVRIGITGDFCPWMRIEEALFNNTWNDLFADVRPWFQESDLNVVDLECPLTNARSKTQKTGPHLKAKPETAKILSSLNCRLVATANNHFLDYGVEGMLETFDALNKEGIDHIGSGLNAEQAGLALIKEIKGMKFAFLNFAENEWLTTQGSKAMCNPQDPISNFSSIQKARESADFVIVIAHGGHEHYKLPSPRMKKLYRFYIDAGAHVVASHHTHIISGYEVYRDAPIFYGLGNFCFDWEGKRDVSWNFGLFLKLQFNLNRSVKFDYNFFRQNSFKEGVYPLSDSESIMMIKEMEKNNDLIGDDDKLSKEFDQYILSLKPLMNTWLQPYLGRWLPSLHKKGLLPNLIGYRKKMLLTNLIRCESHRDVLLNTINPVK